MFEPLPVSSRQLELPGSAVPSAQASDARLSIATYVINLDRSVGRWQHIQDQASQLSITVERIPGVDGSQISAVDGPRYNSRAFILGNGRPMLPQEYGCYLAHQSALKTFLKSDADCAVIMEDDVVLRGDLVARAEAIVEAAPFVDAVKLLNHRAVGYRSVAKSRHGDLIGKCFFGPQGSAACYLVTRSGAEKLLDALEQIKFPFDIALERGWEAGVRVYSVKENVVELSVRSQESQIADRARYRSIKLHGRRRIPTHAFRIVEFFRRIKYAFL